MPTDPIVTPDTTLPETGGNTSPAGTPEGFIELARYNGLLAKVQELTLTNRSLTEQLGTLTSAKEQLGIQLGVKDTEKAVAISERDKTLNEIVTAKAALETELSELRVMALKVKTAKELKRPDLLSVLDTIPGVTDPEAMKTIMTSLAEYADTAASAREKQLMSGITMPVTTTPVTGAPSSEAEWKEVINKMTPGSRERTKAFDDYGAWLTAKNQH